MSLRSFVGEKAAEHVPDFIRRRPWLAMAAGGVALGIYAWHKRDEIKQAAVDAWGTAREMAEKYELNRRLDEAKERLSELGALAVSQLFEKGPTQAEPAAPASPAVMVTPRPTTSAPDLVGAPA